MFCATAESEEVQVFSCKIMNRNRLHHHWMSEGGKPPLGWSSFWSPVVEEMKWSSSFYFLVQACACVGDQDHMYKNIDYLSSLSYACQYISKNVCGLLYEHTFVSSCSHICLCYSSHQCSTPCLSESCAKINIGGQPGKADIWIICLYGLQADLNVRVVLGLCVSVCVSPDIACLLGLIWGSTGELSGFRYTLTCVCIWDHVCLPALYSHEADRHCMYTLLCVFECVMTGDTKSCDHRQPLDPVTPLGLSSVFALGK